MAPCTLVFETGKAGKETRHRLEGWIDGDLAYAKEQCEQNSKCIGIHFDTLTPDFVMLKHIGVPGGQDPERRTCHALLRGQTGSCHVKVDGDTTGKCGCVEAARLQCVGGTHAHACACVCA